jgi:iduronate 2-sulfatase
MLAGDGHLHPRGGNSVKHAWIFCAAAILPWGVGVCAGPRDAEAADAGAARRPNVLFIAVDDLNTRIGCYGDRVAQTPHLDRLAQGGIRFDRAYCQFPLCNPSRMSLLLGRYPTTTRSIDFAHPALWGRDWVSLPQHFRNQGYDVRLLGKIFHFDPGLMKGWFHEETPGPEYPPDWSAGEKWVRKSQEVHSRMMGDLTRWEPYRSLAPPPNGFAKMLRTWANVFGPAPDAEEVNAAANARAYEWTADVKHAAQATELLAGLAASDKPFFLGVGFYKPHVPLVAPKRFFDRYPPEKMPLPEDFASTPRADDAVPRQALRYNLDLFFEEPVTPQRAREAVAAYYACISFMDEKLGSLLDALDRLGLRDNTVIVLWGDHGWHLGEKGMWAKGTLFDVSARAPLIIVDPRRKAGSQGVSQGSQGGRGCPRTVEFVDIYPTLVELCGLPMPRGLEGKSLAPLIENPQGPWTKPAYTVVAREDWLARSVRTERWCYTEWDEGRRGVELYDVERDPHERKNLAADPALASTIAPLRKLLRDGPVAKSLALNPTASVK